MSREDVPESLVEVPPERPRRAKLDIPRIKFWSWLGLESVAWGFVIGHLVKWACNFAYFATWQVRYSVGYKGTNFTVWYLKDWWDRLPVHIANALGQPWFATQAEPLWWVTWRHDIRDVGFALATTIIVQFLFTKPKYAPDDNPGLRRYLTSVPLAIGAALVPIAIVGVIAWKLPWLTHHGLHVPASSPFATEANGYITAGEWIAVLMGVLGGIAARPFIKRVADDVQWFFAERSAGHVRSESGLRGSRVIGTPIHRARVHWLLERKAQLAARNPWLVRGLLAVAVIGLMFAGAGAWVTLAGPAAVH
jgi:hypothetical protein